MSFQKLEFLVYGDVPELWQMGLQDAASPIMEKVIIFHDHIMLIVIVIVTFVLWLIIGAIYQAFSTSNFMEWLINRKLGGFIKRNVYSPYFIDWPLIEILWTILPAVILVFLAFPSLQLLYIMDEVFDPALTIKVVGHQWYWSYEYSDYGQGHIEYDSYMIPTEDLQLGELRLLEVDNRLVVPINTQVRVLVTGADVLHSFAVPSLGVKIDAVPGRLNQTNFILKRPGVFYGQCSEICGANHSFMPIVIEGVSLEKYLEWVNGWVIDPMFEEEILLAGETPGPIVEFLDPIAEIMALRYESGILIWAYGIWEFSWISALDGTEIYGETDEWGNILLVDGLMTSDGNYVWLNIEGPLEIKDLLDIEGLLNKAGLNEPGNMEGIDEPGNMEGLDEQGNMEGLDEQGYIEGIVEPGNMEGLDEQGYIEGIDEQGYIEGIVEPGNMEGLDEQGYIEGIDEPGNMEGTEDNEASKAIKYNEASKGNEASKATEGTKATLTIKGNEDTLTIKYHEASKGNEASKATEGTKATLTIKGNEDTLTIKYHEASKGNEASGGIEASGGMEDTEAIKYLEVSKRIKDQRDLGKTHFGSKEISKRY